MTRRYVKTVVEAGKGDKLYQRTTHENFQDTKAEQLEEQGKIFRNVGAAVTKHLEDTLAAEQE